MGGSIVAAIGASSQTDSARAGKQAAEQALAQVTGPEPKLALVFGSSWFNQSHLIQGVAETLQDIPFVGASTAGEILAGGPASHTCVVVVLCSKTLKWATGFGEHLDQAPRRTGQQVAYMATKAFTNPQRIGFLFFGDGLINRYGDALRGMQEVLGTNSTIIGGLAGDDLRFSQTFQYHRTQVLTGSIVGVLFGGDGSMGAGLEHGFAPISKPRRVTRAAANVLFELDRKPAASVYEEYLGAEMVRRMRQEGLTRQSVAYPLGLQPEGSDSFILRNVASFRDDGSLWCTGEVTEGFWMQLMISSRSLSIDAARKAAQKATQAIAKPACVLVFSSFARPKLQGSAAAAEEIAAIRQVVGPNVPLAGFYTYGEQGPVNPDVLQSYAATQTGSVLVVAIGA